MLCPNCKKEIQNNVQFCPECGTAVTMQAPPVANIKKQKKPITKKWWFWVIIIVVLITLIGSFAGDKNETPNSVEQISKTDTIETTNKSDKIQITEGTKITTDNMQVIINNVELTYDVLPDDTSGYYSHYEADAGKVYICVDIDVTNTAKQNLDCDNIGRVKADYNNGFTYSGFAIVDDPSLGFTYANISSITPLETKGMKWLIECPQEVDETQNPLFLEFTIDSEKYIYTIR